MQLDNADHEHFYDPGSFLVYQGGTLPLSSLASFNTRHVLVL